MDEHTGDLGYAKPLVVGKIELPGVPSAKCRNCDAVSRQAAESVKRARANGYTNGLLDGKDYKLAHDKGYKAGYAKGGEKAHDEHYFSGYLGGHHAALDEVEQAARKVNPTLAIGFLHDYHWDGLRIAVRDGAEPPGWTVAGGVRVSENRPCVCGHAVSQHLWRSTTRCRVRACTCSELREPEGQESVRGEVGEWGK
jgi:hypothetical protein